MTTPRRSQHRADQGSRSLRLDPYALDEVTITLEEWRRLQPPPRRSPSRVRRDVRRPVA